MVFTVDTVEGNSNIGVPVFSRFGKKSNYNLIVFSPQKNDSNKDASQNNQDDLNDDNLKFKLKTMKDQIDADKKEFVQQNLVTLLMIYQYKIEWNEFKNE